MFNINDVIMNIEYLIKLWRYSNLDTILIKDLPLARGTDKLIVEPTMILNKNEKICFGEELCSYDYLRVIFKKTIFEFVSSDDMLEVKVIYRNDKE